MICPIDSTWRPFRARIRGVALIALVAVATVRASVPPPVSYSEKHFRVFDALSYRNKPDLSSFGLRPIRVIERFWPQGSAKLDVNVPGIISEIAKLGDYQGLIYIDIEHWPVSGVSAEVAGDNIAKLTQVVDAARKAAPLAQFGYYAVMPTGAYWDIVSKDQTKMAVWHENNRRTEKLAQHVDVVFPSLYTFYNDEKRWEEAARTLLVEARRYSKPVYAFLWPEFHDSNSELSGTEISPLFWRRQLEVCYELSDGIVIWGGWRKTKQSRWVQLEWNESARWWMDTKAFLSRDGRFSSSK